ncbi:tol-pal system protein YbgF [Methylibium sp.]|uniref:tol-pal system protein YbgF n=1 Tax=Methylibium sp. TaxID=2067992 RepID=UPI003D0B9D15
MSSGTVTAKRAGWRTLVLTAALLGAGAAQAGLFDDDEARRAILDARARIDQVEQGSKAREAELTEQVNQLRRSLLDLNSTIEQLRADLAKLRGSDEQLQRDVADLQRRQKDVQQGIDERLRKMEPQKVTLDGKEFLAEPEETRLYGDAVNVLRQGDFTGAVNAFSAFQRRYPSSGYSTAALYWLANAQYGKRDYKDAIPSFRALVAAAPDHPRAPEALLSIANCQIELKDTKAARRTLDELLKAYPKSEAAQAGRERLASLK